MSNSLKDIHNYKSYKVEADKLKILEVIRLELLKFNFEEDYLKEGNLQLLNASAITFHSCVMENFTDTRTIDESLIPNFSNVPPGKKRISDFNVWDYELNYKKEFENCSDEFEIIESHHAIGCNTCKQQGKIRCSSCSGAGNITCSSCGGRGENKCSNCNGQVDIKCWSCDGRGIKETGFGENRRTERCTSCSGRGSNKCSSCSNGWINCSTCSGGGKVTCYNCHGSGEITCFECDGHQTMDHFFFVTADFINISQTLYLTNPYPGFDQNKSKSSNFNIQEKLFEIKEKKFEERHFHDIKSSPFYNQILSFLDFSDSNETKLITSKITFFENFYFEVTFSFYDSKYTLFVDKNLENSYFNENKPSDQYELDLLRKSIESSVKNELSVTKKTIQKLAKYDFINISEKEIISAIEDTENVYEAFDEYKNKNYTKAENTLRLVSDIKKSEDDYTKLRKKLNRTYFINTTIFGLIASFFIFYKLFDKEYEFKIIHFSILFGITVLCLLINKVTKNIHFARWLIILLISIQLIYIFSIESVKGKEIKIENQKIADFEEFKKGKIIISIDNNEESLFNYESFAQGINGEAILLDERKDVEDFKHYFVVKPGFVERWYRSEVKIPNLVVKEQRRVYSDNDLNKILMGNPNPNEEIILRDWEKGLEFYAKISDLYLIECVAIEYMFNNRESFDSKETHIVYMPKYVYELLKQNKSIEKYSFSNIPSTSIFESDLFTNSND